MPQLMLAIYFLLLLASGYALLSHLLPARRMHVAQIASLCFAGGAGAVGIALFICSLFGHKPSRAILFVLIVITAVALLWVFVQKKQVTLLQFKKPKRFDAVSILAIAAWLLVGLAFYQVLAYALMGVVTYIDEYAIWMFRAKVVAMQALLPIPPALLDPGMSYSHQDYPLGFPLLIAGAYSAMGQMNVALAKLLLVGIYLSMCGVLYGALREMLRSGYAIAIAAAVVVAPIFRTYAPLATADDWYALQGACGMVLFLHWLERDDDRSFLLACIFFAFAAFAKNEGLALLCVIALTSIVRVAFRRDRKTVLTVVRGLALSLVILLPWLIYRRQLPHTHEDYGGKFLNAKVVLAGLSRWPQMIPQFFATMFQVKNVGAIWILLIASAIIGRRGFEKSAIRFLWFALIAQLFTYVFAYTVTPWDLNVLIPMTASRLLMHASPTAALLIGLHAREILGSQDAKNHRHHRAKATPQPA